MSKFMLATALMGLTSLANASTMSYSVHGDIALTTTNWMNTITVDKFDPTLGTLCKVEIKLIGNVQGDISVESLDNAPSTINATLQSQVRLNTGLGLIVVTLPAVMRTLNATAFDGSIDFGGTSGAQWNNIDGMDMQADSSMDAGVLAGFTGPGTIDLAVDALGQSTASGAGNIVTVFRTMASAEAWVRYTYKTDDIPEPASLALAGAGVLAIALLRRRK
ncbi:MAG: PEP-CTERM sorting domain-containing protein [Acidobacteria bacterium]|nr:PEP-CTERM sorting domain-containing protein [Acidobacteriota bacterium]